MIMMLKSFKQHLLELSAIALAIMVLVCPKMSVAAENDPYTYSCIPLEDSAAKVNYKLNEILEEVIGTVNRDIAKFKRNSSDTYAEFYFSHYYYKNMFVDKYGHDAFGVFETCIDTNTCEGWPYFERISLKPGESIYSEAKYTKLSKKFVSSTIQLCDVRMGTDKLTHLLKDGFKLYNATKQYNSTHDELLKYSMISENTFFGKKTTGVYSRADIVANTSGIKFFEDLFSKHLVRQKNGQLKFSKVNICDYVNSKFDERVSKNTYSEDAAKVAILNEAILNRVKQCSDENKLEILARKSQPASIGDSDKALSFFSGVIDFITSSDFRLAEEVLIESVPVFQGRADTVIPKEQ